MWVRAAIALLASLLLATPAAGEPASRVRADDGEWLSYGHDNRLTNAVVSPTLRRLAALLERRRLRGNRGRIGVCPRRRGRARPLAAADGDGPRVRDDLRD